MSFGYLSMSKPISDEVEQQIRLSHVVTPSNISLWFGRWRPGDRITEQQREAAQRMRVDPANTMIVKVKVTPRQMWWPTTQPAPHRQIHCPIIGRLPDGRIKVITPIGDPVIVQPDGSLRPNSFKRSK